jgi:hypothetical protein
MIRYLFILFMFISLSLSAQTGGRVKQRSNQRRLLKISNKTWHFNPTKPGKLQNHRREGRKLFTRSETRGGRQKARIQSRINSYRFRHRIRGNEVFHKKKYNR